jgi:hypothetical protein
MLETQGFFARRRLPWCASSARSADGRRVFRRGLSAGGRRLAAR